MTKKICKDSVVKVFDTIIIGAGPSGITSGIYLSRRKLCVLLIYDTLGGQASITADIENYSGFRFISGIDFANKLNEHLQEYDIQVSKDNVIELKKINNLFIVKTKTNQYLTKTVLIATGARQKMLGISGENEYLNKGVAYCATCDAPLYNGRDIAIVGGGNSAMEAAIQLEKYAKSISIITINSELLGEQILIDKVKSFKNLKILTNTKILSINGDRFVSSIKIEKNKKIQTINVGGVFIEIGYIPNSELVDVKKNSLNEIIINNNNETSVKGIFASGDVTDIKVKQIIVAAGEGAKAATSIAEYLSRMPFKS